MLGAMVLPPVAALASLAALAHLHGGAAGPQETKPAPSTDPIPALIAAANPARILGDVEKLAAFGTRHTLSETDSDVRGIGAARRWLRAELETISQGHGDRLVIREQRFTARVGPADAELVNVYGFLPGRVGDELGRTFVVVGHYDSRASKAFDTAADAPGANDDASGTAVVLEVARLLSGHEFEANLVFLLVPGEEQGLFGSKHFAADAAARGVHIEGAFGNDIVGGTEGGNGIRDEVTIRCFSPGDTVYSPSRELARALAGSAERYVPEARTKLVFRADRFGRGGDHQSFFKAGFPALRLTEANEHYQRQHQDVRVVDGVAYGDLPAHVSGTYMARVAQVNAAALAELALAPPAPERLSMRAAVSYDTEMGWSPSKGYEERGDDHSYEIVWRDTTSPVWTNAQAVPAEVRTQPARGNRPARQIVQGAVRGVTADTNFFGVRALSALGHRSCVVMPRRP